MSFKAIIKGESNVAASAFTIDIVALLAAAGGATAAQDNEGLWLMNLNWEVTKADTLGAGGAFDLRVQWEAPAGAILPRVLGGTTRNLNDVNNVEAYYMFMVRSAPGTPWNIISDFVGGVGDSLISWRFCALHIEGADALAF